MVTSLLVWIFIGLFVYAFYKYAVYRPKGFPPGPPRIPLFGCYLFMMMINRRYLHKAVLKFTQWYKSDMIGMYLGSFLVITVHSEEIIREVLNNSVFDGRARLFATRMRDPDFKPAGIFFNDGPVWKEQRRFILRFLRDFGFGRRFQQLELIMQEQLSDMLEVIRCGPKYDHETSYVQEGGYRIFLPYFFNLYSVNSLFHIMYNEVRPRSEQAEIWELIRWGMQFQRCNDDYGKLLSIQPWIRFIFPNWSQYNQIKESNKHMRKFFEDMIDRHLKTYDESCDRNFIDMYIREMKEAEAQGNTNTSFTKNQFILSLVDFSFPAFTAVGVQISFLVQYFLLLPEVQKKIQKEIDDVVGSGRLPTLEDRKSMHYTEATLREVLRIETLVPSSVSHKALEDTTLGGYKVPKNTSVLTSLFAFHSDKKVWGDPENFRPERFLDGEGKLCLNKDVSLPFGGGKRLCAGETFARNMMFLLIGALCQNFNFVLAPQDKMPDLNTNLGGAIISPKDFWVQLEER